MRIANSLKPEYIFRPAQILRRLKAALSLDREVVARLPYGWPITVHADDDIGKSLLRLGVYDLPLSEVIWRLTDSGETVIDAGANIGYVTGLFARRVGPTGRVFAFEPHPHLCEELRRNVSQWQTEPQCGRVDVRQRALSDGGEQAVLEIPVGFDWNRGISRLVADSTQVDGQYFRVVCERLDTTLADVDSVGVAKVDVEGHEETLLHGASETLQLGKVRDWVFEHQGSYPSAVTAIFEESGYRVLAVRRTFWRPVLCEPRGFSPNEWEPVNFLATLDAARALARMNAPGWKCLRA